MCGIAGIFALDGQEHRVTQALHCMSNKMKKRGPDDEGYLLAWFSDRKAIDFRGDDTVLSDESFLVPHLHVQNAYSTPCHVALAHRRLSIIDLSPAGHQPMRSDDGRYWIVYNGEIYNFQEVAQELASLGVCFRGHSDTEVILYAYRQWGAVALQKFNGMFALAIWDNREQELFCARDRIGIKPFYYTIQGGLFIFASDIKTIIASGLYHPEVSLEGLYHNLSFGVAPRPLTAFKDVYALEQAHWLRIEATGQMTKQRYWQLPVGTQDHSMSEADAVALLEEHLHDAVKRQLIADVPVGTFMSGGIDSTTISAIAAQHHPGIQAFTLAFDPEIVELDELAQAQATAAMYPMQHIIRTVKASDILDHIQELVLCHEEPYYAISPNYLISQLVADHRVKVILNGLGGDELFGGYTYYRWPQRWQLLRRLTLFTGLLSKLGPQWERLHTVASVESADRLHSALFAYQAEQSKQHLFQDPAVQDFNSIEYLHQLYVGNGTEFCDAIEALCYMDLISYIGNHHVYRVDQFTMEFSIEGRFPLLDHKLIEAAFHIPSRFKVHGNTQKYVLRRVAEKLIHPSCLQMKKKGFSLPMDRWMRGSLQPLVHKKLTQLMQRDIFAPAEIRRRWEAFETHSRSYYSLWHLVMVELWFETFLDGQAA
jgi:asparagine synthase (glutamine-hydrolysing)